MNYQKIYNNIINRAQNRAIEGYAENHHIIPRSLGGSDDINNIVKLTAKEHFICHLLLAKIYGGKMSVAAFMMSNRGIYKSKKYAWLKEQHSYHVSSDLNRSKKISLALSGKKKSEEHKNNWYISRMKTGWNCSDEQRKIVSQKLKGHNNPMFGKTHSEDAKNKIKEANRQRIVCPHCNKEGGIAIMKRWHFNNCKFLSE